MTVNTRMKPVLDKYETCIMGLIGDNEVLNVAMKDGAIVSIGKLKMDPDKVSNQNFKDALDRLVSELNFLSIVGGQGDTVEILQQYKLTGEGERYLDYRDEERHSILEFNFQRISFVHIVFLSGFLFGAFLLIVKLIMTAITMVNNSILALATLICFILYRIIVNIEKAQKEKNE